MTSFRTDSDAFNVIPEHVELRGTARALDAGGPGPDRGAGCARSSRRPPRALRRRGAARLPAATTRSPSTPRPQTDFAARVAAEVVGAAARRRRGAAGDGRRGLLLHAERPPRRLHLRRQRRHRQAPPPEVRLQRRADPGRLLLLGAAGRDRDARLHANATTTPKVRAEIQASSEPVAVLARRFGVSETTIRRWRGRTSVEDRSHVRHNLGQATSPVEEAIIAELRTLAGLSLDDIAEAMNRCVNPRPSRGSVWTALRRAGLSGRQRRVAALGSDREGAGKPQPKPFEAGALRLRPCRPQIPRRSSRAGASTSSSPSNG